MRKLLLAIFVIAIAIGFSLLVIYKIISSDAIAALIGVLAGSLISATVQYYVSRADRKSQLRLAALEKRLAAHQKAYSLWRKLLFAQRDNKEILEIIIECQEWWNDNCLYLSPLAREAFMRAFQNAHIYWDMKRCEESPVEMRKVWEIVKYAGKPIIEGVDLPVIGESEDK
jgi:hypothetical protein